MKERSWISWVTSWRGEPEIADLNFRGRLWSSSRCSQSEVMASMAGVASMISSAAIPATGDPRMTRGTSPQPQRVDRPTASSFSQIAGTSSMRIQWSWMFCRSVKSPVPRAKSREISPTVRSWVVLTTPPSKRTRIMKNLSCSSALVALPVCSPPRSWRRCVYRPTHLNLGARSSSAMESKPCFE